MPAYYALAEDIAERLSGEDRYAPDEPRLSVAVMQLCAWLEAAENMEAEVGRLRAEAKE